MLGGGGLLKGEENKRHGKNGNEMYLYTEIGVEHITGRFNPGKVTSIKQNLLNVGIFMYYYN